MSKWEECARCGGPCLASTRVSSEVAEITLLDACEIIPCTEQARASITGAGWAE